VFRKETRARAVRPIEVDVAVISGDYLEAMRIAITNRE
jgi:hypothetical protein